MLGAVGLLSRAAGLRCYRHRLYIFGSFLQKSQGNIRIKPRPRATQVRFRKRIAETPQKSLASAPCRRLPSPAMKKRKTAGTLGRPRNESGLRNGWQGRALRVRRLKSTYPTATLLAARVGVSQGTVSRWERGRSEPNPTQLAKLAKVLRCKPGDFGRVPKSKADRALLAGMYGTRV